MTRIQRTIISILTIELAAYFGIMAFVYSELRGELASGELPTNADSIGIPLFGTALLLGVTIAIANVVAWLVWRIRIRRSRPAA